VGGEASRPHPAVVDRLAAATFRARASVCRGGLEPPRLLWAGPYALGNSPSRQASLRDPSGLGEDLRRRAGFTCVLDAATDDGAIAEHP
jgi:hypothetical protein